MPFGNEKKKAYDKYSTWNRQIWHQQNMVQYKNGTPSEKMPKGFICQRLSWVIFKRKFLNLFMIQTHGDGILKSRFSHSRMIFLVLSCV